RPHKSFVCAPIKPFTSFLTAVERVLENCVAVSRQSRGPVPILYKGDARNLRVADSSIDLVLTSPPYLNAIDYMRCSKFSLVWMGYKVADLRQVRTDSVGTEAADESLDDDKEVQTIIDALKLRPKLEKRFQRILGRYIHDMRGAIAEVGRVLAKAGRAVYVVGENTLRGTYIR